MMQSMIRKIGLLGISVFLSICTFSQTGRKQDLALWPWIQIEKKIGRHQYVEFQYQVRFNNHISQYNRSNYYFMYGIDFLKHFQAEGLYQLNSNPKADEHTFFAGLTYKQNISQHVSLLYRSSFQTTRNDFTGDKHVDKPYSEWRNRLRSIYKFNNVYSVSLSAEPYLKITDKHPVYLSRIRFVSQFSYRFNKYQTFSAFYLLEPDIVYYSTPSTDHVIGLAYHFTLPDKMKSFKKIFKPKSIDNADDNEMLKDTFN